MMETLWLALVAVAVTVGVILTFDLTQAQSAVVGFTCGLLIPAILRGDR